MDEKSSGPSPVASEKKIAANRANAQHSTGPRTPEGKALEAQFDQARIARQRSRDSNHGRRRGARSVR